MSIDNDKFQFVEEKGVAVMVTKLKYGNTNTYFIRGDKGSILLDTDYAGTLQMFYKAIKTNDISLKDITYILATHYHPDHMGLVGELVSLGVKFLVMDTQVPNLHFSDEIISRDKTLRFLPSVPEDEYRRRYNDLTERFRAKEEKHKRLTERRKRMVAESIAIGGMLSQLTELEAPPIEFDEKLWHAVVERLTVYNDNRLVYSLKDGSEITVML